MYSELWATLRDWRECGDLRGHLWAWLELARGRVTVGDRAGMSPTGDTATPDPAGQGARIMALWARLEPEDRAVVLRLVEALAR